MPVDGGRFVKQTFFGVVFAAVALSGVSIAAHHGAASFDTTKEYTLKGKVTEWIWANPHCFLKFDAKDDTGDVRNWAVEVSNPTDMTRLGWARTSFKFGDEVTVYAGVRLRGDISVYPRLKIPSGIRVPPGSEIAGAADVLRYL